jgi:thiol-disulfide isomerase/thioredoxin
MCADDATRTARDDQRAEEFLVVCLCADWCTTCRDYRPAFDELAAQFADTRFYWLDIEEQADDLGDLDIENFPTLFIARRDAVLFFGTMLPYVSHLRRLIETFHEQTPEQSRAYAHANAERRGWQANADLCQLARVVRR